MKHELNYAEFYITNVCNFNCTNCNRFNNYQFTGQQKWEDYADVYKQWSRLITLRNICILGGEPTLNPTFLEWVDGIATLWPDANIKITSNGTRLNSVKGFYDTLATYNGRVSLELGLHNESRKEDITRDCKQFLSALTKESLNNEREIDDVWAAAYNQIRDKTWPDCNTPNEFKSLPAKIRLECTSKGISDGIFANRFNFQKFTDKNNVAITVYTNDMFDASALIENNGVFRLHNSNPDEAVSACLSKTCHHFIQGKLYKCGAVALLPEFYEQFHFDISPEDKELMHAYEPLTITSTSTKVTEFVNELKLEQSIPQCKFCPVTPNGQVITAGTKKTRIKKK